MPDTPSLSGFRFFSEVPLKTLEAISAACKVLDFPAQTVVFQPGEPADTLYCLVEGEVELSLKVNDKSLKVDVRHEESVHAQMMDHVREIVVDTVRSGQIFGWTALVGNGKRAVIAKCSKATKVCALPAAELNGMTAKDPTLGCLIFKRLAEIIAKRLNARTDRLLEAWVEAFGASKVTLQ
ncbi:MAG: cyclic nucleotide-binding domain-containing protein [Deltaproteobacteria bacterium]|nr:cyclic nucleotide-binding domain-containing protein [Deltaproteobacteria bacterium]